MIIGFSGRKQSGKDFASRITSRIFIEQIIASTHRYMSFDDRLQRIQADLDLNPLPTYNPMSHIKKIRIAQFADPVKKIGAIITGTDRLLFENNSYKNTEIDHLNLPQHVNTPRKLLQIIGTEFGQQMLYKNIWVDLLFNEYSKLLEEKGILIISDVRFPHEAQAIKDRNGYVIRIENLSDVGEKDSHASETSLNSKNWDFDRIAHWKDKTDLYEMLLHFLIHKGILHKLHHSLPKIYAT